MADISETQAQPAPGQMAGTPAAPRVERRCDGCGQVDDQPHHQVVVPRDGGLVMISQHFACCAGSDEGCPDGSCAQSLNGS
jgi:hypothetical protein